MLSSLRRAKRLVEGTRPWRRASRLCLRRDLFVTRAGEPLPAASHMAATLEWLKRAQDATGDGGVAGRYRLNGGFSASYPETTGYIIPTLLALSQRRFDNEIMPRAERMVEFLLRVQLPSGAFPAGEMGAEPRPSIFNTAQVVQGLTAWYGATRDRRALDAAGRAARWMLLAQEPSGAFVKHTYGDRATTYLARAAWPLAECGLALGDRKLLGAASHYVDWLLLLADSRTGWVDHMGFFGEDHAQRRALTHTIAYTYEGLLELEKVLERSDLRPLLRTACGRLLERLEETGTLAAAFDHEWRPCADYVCLTGAAQMALVFTRLYRREHDARLLNGALKLVDIVKATQLVGSPFPELNGAVAGSSPIWAPYLANSFPNWAAKFFLDALLETEEALSGLRAARPHDEWTVPASVPRVEVSGAAPRETSALRFVLVTAPRSKKGAATLAGLIERGETPVAVVLEQRAGSSERPLGERARRKLAREGPVATIRASLARFIPCGTPADHGESVAAISRARGIPVLWLPALDVPEAAAALSELEADLIILAGATTLSPEVLTLPRFGTIAAHGGLLPRFRGSHSAEWAALTGGPIGATVHYVDGGLDTGRILAVRVLDPGEIEDLEELEGRLLGTQADLLAAILLALRRDEELPVYVQEPSEGARHFDMHPALRTIAGTRLRARGREGSRAG